MKELLKTLETLDRRYKLVVARLEAISKEQEELTQEKELLERLISMWERREYDSIDEERRVTEHLLKKDVMSDKSTLRRKIPSAKGLILQKMIEILRNHREGLRSARLQEELDERMGYKVSAGSFNYNIHKLLELDDSSAVVKKDSRYILKAHCG